MKSVYAEKIPRCRSQLRRSGAYQGLSDIDKLNYSTQANDGCLQFITTFDGP